MSRIVIADLGTGNLRSVSKAVEHVCGGANGAVCISHEPTVIAAAEHLILPGQGAIGAWMARLTANAELHSAVSGRLAHGPVLGICLGLQALYTRSEENGGTPGLGILKGTVRHFAGHDDHDERRGHNERPGHNERHGNLKIPHMGWNRVRHTLDHPLWHGIEDRERFYFVHSYFVDSARDSEAGGAGSDDVVGECEYGGVFTAAAARDNLFATQFHPEKSQCAGLKLLENFVNWNGA